MSTAPRSSPAWTGRHDDHDLDALTELFLGEPDAAPNAAQPPAAGARPAAAPVPARSAVEVLMIGHVPMRAGVWASQYAREVARAERRTVALVRRQSREMTIELYAADPDRMAPRHESTDDLHAAMAIIAREADRWIVYADDAARPLLAGALNVDIVTMLATTTRMACIDAYRTLKELIGGHQGQVLRREPEYRLAIISNDEQVAADAAANIVRTVQSFLNCRVTLAPRLGRTSPTYGRCVYRGGLVTDLTSLIGDLAGSAAVTHEPSPAIAPAGIDPLEYAEIPAFEEPEPVIALDPAEFDLIDDPVPASAPAPLAAAEPPPAAIVQPPAPPPTPTPAPPATLAAHIPGLIALQPRSPDDESVELARDAQGTLHLLRRDDDAHGVSALTTVSAWARKHHQLLAMLVPDLADASQREPILHIFTDRPRVVRPLLDADLRIHLLANVSVEGRSGWYCTELN